MADLRYLLAIYVHAHQTGNSVPPHIDAEARVALADEPTAPEMVEVTDESWDALVNRLWDNYETIGHQGERFMYEADFCTALDIARQEIARWVNPAPAPPADGEVAEVVSKLQKLCADLDYDDRGDDAGCCYRAAELLQRQALVPVSVAERPWEREGWCDELGRCWWGRPDTGDWSADWTLATPEAIAEFCEFSPQTVCLPAHALPEVAE